MRGGRLTSQLRRAVPLRSRRRHSLRLRKRAPPAHWRDLVTKVVSWGDVRATGDEALRLQVPRQAALGCGRSGTAAVAAAARAGSRSPMRLQRVRRQRERAAFAEDGRDALLAVGVATRAIGWQNFTRPHTWRCCARVRSKSAARRLARSKVGGRAHAGRAFAMAMRAAVAAAFRCFRQTTAHAMDV